MKTIVLLLALTFTQQSFAFDKEDSFADLQAAVSKSNLDYNTYRKEMIEEENDRVVVWGQRDVSAVKIEASIEQEARDFKINN